MDPATREDVLNRLKRIEGQVRGIQGMVQQDKYCVDILQQIAAIRGALDRVSLLILQQHLETCVREAMTSGNPEEREAKVRELLQVFQRYAS